MQIRLMLPRNVTITDPAGFILMVVQTLDGGTNSSYFKNWEHLEVASSTSSFGSQNMYARYIPPPRGGAPTANTEPIASSQPAQIASQAQPTAYARYVPPAKTNPPISSSSASGSHNVAPPQHVRFDDIDSNKEGPPAKRVKLVQENETAAIPDKDKPSKPKKSKRKSSGQDDRSAHIDSINGGAAQGLEGGKAARDEIVDGSDNIGNPPISVQSPAKEETPDALSQSGPDTLTSAPKRKEKTKKKKSKVENALGEVEDDVPSRHKAILEKKAKSIKPPEPNSEDVVMDDAPPDGATPRDKTPEIEFHGLEPIPQPKPLELDTGAPSYETLPPWLSMPTRISQSSSAPFTEFGLSPDLGISPEIAERLATKGYKQAFAIQTGVIPLLLPHHCKSMQGDVLVSAATGSGKTLAYTLPMMRDISQSNRHISRLRALIVVPTRELVKQVQQVCDDCAGVFALDGAKRRPRIAMAMGSQSFEHEQSLLVDREESYDPQAYKQRLRRSSRLGGSESDDDNDVRGTEDSGYNTEDEEREAIRRREDKLQTLPNHVITYKSKVDILICTPGRLVEHIKFTPGFSLDFVRWLIVDEADKLLGQTFQQWLDVVIPRLQNNKGTATRNHKQSNLSGVRKVILSATMTRDLDQLEGLKLRRPKLVVLEGSVPQGEDGAHQTEHVLPELLEESALKVGDPNMKPLFLVDLLRSRHILNLGIDVKEASGIDEDDDDDDTSSSGSDSESESDTSSESGSDSESEPQPNSESKSAGPKVVSESHEAPSKARTQSPTVLIFTKSNETALRLSRLLALLVPSLKPVIGTLTSTTPYTTRRETFRSFNAGKLRIMVASDLVARGIDLPSLDHVINYDMPSSIASYVHRVGRTARAGNKGTAWTLFTNAEARWFWNEVASHKIIQRNRPVERIRVTEEKEEAFEDKVARYEAALEKLGEEAGHARQKASKG
ncbi:P-loop containing nucleoside triphosphate hydrolase protein [Poronia punctata]|nr:P-loop containing nucleoside triphosphate hydrolase protein [Poronia punctata]